MADVDADDPLTFRRLFDAHADALRRYARRIVRSRETAEDLVQEVFFRLWRGRGTVDMGPGIRAYLYVATRSRALDHLKHEQSAARVQTLAFPHGMTGDEPGLGPDAERNLETDDISRAIEQVMASMPPRQREVAALRLRHQLPTAAIAGRLGISPRTVEVHIARATKALREQLPTLLER
ncbi:MAG: RNA polymerase sigma-70 factor, partial [Gemmatimonadaceae bacterium]